MGSCRRRCVAPWKPSDSSWRQKGVYSGVAANGTSTPGAENALYAGRLARTAESHIMHIDMACTHAHAITRYASCVLFKRSCFYITSFYVVLAFEQSYITNK